MSNIHETTLDGVAIILLMKRPNWSSPVEVTYSRAVEILETVDGREDRSPLHDTLRLSIAASYVLTREDAADLRTKLADADTTKKIGIGVWPDMMAAAVVGPWADRIHESYKGINWDATGFTLFDPASPPSTYLHIAPLLVGWLDRPSLNALTEEGPATYRLTVVEDGPATFAVSAAPETVSDAWPATLTPNWRRVSDYSEDKLVRERVGQGRELQLDRDEAPMAWGQEAVYTMQTRALIRTLLNHWNNHHGPHESFSAPTHFRPGSNLPSTPYTTIFRYYSETLRLTYRAAMVAEATVKLIQLPWEISTQVDAEQPRITYLYEFTRTTSIAPIQTTTDRYTSWESDITSNGDVFIGGEAMEHDSIHSDIRLGLSTNLKSWVFAGNPLLKLIPYGLETPLNLTIWRVDPSSAAAREWLFTGEVLEATATGKAIQASCSFLGHKLDRKGPDLLFGLQCNASLSDSMCGLAVDDWTLKGTKLTPVNLVSFPNGLDNSAWAKTGSTVAADSITDPDGTQLADKLTEGNATGIHQVRSPIFTLTAATQYVFSVFIKAAGRSQGAIRLSRNWYSPAGPELLKFDLSAGSIISTTAKIVKSGIVDVGNGWYLVYGVTTAEVTVGERLTFRMYNSNGMNSYAGDGSSGLYFYHTEVLPGQFPTFADNSRELDVTITDNPPSAALEDDWLSNGIVYTPGPNWEVRHIVRSIYQSNPVQRLRLQRPFSTAVNTVHMRPFCGGTWGECKSKFSNEINFRGHPRAPRLNPSLPKPTTQQVFAKK